MAVDISGISYFVPILSFLLVFVIVYAILAKLKFGNNFIQLLTAFLVAAIFVTGFGTVSYLKNISIWFAILIVSGLFLTVILGLFGEIKGLTKGLGIAFVIMGIIAFVISGMVVYGSYIGPYLPWGNGIGDGTSAGDATSWLYSGRTLGAVLLVVVGVIVALILSKSK